VFDQVGGSVATGQATIQFYPTSMSNCTYTSDSYTTGVNSTKYFGFLPFGPVLNGSSLQVTMPLWFNGATNSPASYTCQGVSVISLSLRIQTLSLWPVLLKLLLLPISSTLCPGSSPLGSNSTFQQWCSQSDRFVTLGVSTLSEDSHISW